MTDPATTIAEIYSRLGWDYPKEVREAIRTNIENKPRGSRGRHRYALEDFGLDGASERKRFAFYQERFGVADEA